MGVRDGEAACDDGEGVHPSGVALPDSPSDLRGRRYGNRCVPGIRETTAGRVEVGRVCGFQRFEANMVVLEDDGVGQQHGAEPTRVHNSGEFPAGCRERRATEESA